MRIGVLSDTWLPTEPRGGHGLGRVAWDLASGLAQRGHNVTLFTGHGSQESDRFWLRRTGQTETARAEIMADGGWFFDAWLDLSHFHDLSRVRPDWPVVNYIMDTACPYEPPNCAVVNAWQQESFPNARIVPLGVDVDAIPFDLGPGDYLAFCHKLHRAKGIDIALELARRVAVQVEYAGALVDGAAPERWRGEIRDDALLYDFLGGALGLLSPTRLDAGGRVNLESAACGTPVLTFAGTGTACHVEDGVSGFVCRDFDAMVQAVEALPSLDRARAREWAAATHGLAGMIDGVESLVEQVAEGITW